MTLNPDFLSPGSDIIHLYSEAAERSQQHNQDIGGFALNGAELAATRQQHLDKEARECAWRENLSVNLTFMRDFIAIIPTVAETKKVLNKITYEWDKEPIIKIPFSDSSPQVARAVLSSLYFVNIGSGYIRGLRDDAAPYYAVGQKSLTDRTTCLLLIDAAPEGRLCAVDVLTEEFSDLEAARKAELGTALSDGEVEISKDGSIIINTVQNKSIATIALPKKTYVRKNVRKLPLLTTLGLKKWVLLTRDNESVLTAADYGGLGISDVEFADYNVMAKLAELAAVFGKTDALLQILEEHTSQSADSKNSSEQS